MAEVVQEPPKRKPNRHGRRFGIAGTGALLLALVILIPAAAFSASREVVRPGDAHIYRLSQTEASAADLDRRTTVQIILENLLPWDGTIRLRIAAHRSCAD